MHRYLIERTYTVDMDSVPAAATRSKALGHYRFPEIVWEHSHVVLDSKGTPKSFCVYSAPSEEMVREHAQRMGDHTNAGIPSRSHSDRRRSASSTWYSAISATASRRLTSA
jgi:hypothetical protein